MAPCRRDVTGLRRSLKPLALRCEELLLTMTDVKKPHQNNVKIKHTYEYISCCKYMQPPILRGCALVASHMASDYSLRSWSIPQRDKNVINVGYCCICECSAIWRLLRLQRVSKRLLNRGITHTALFLVFEIYMA